MAHHIYTTDGFILGSIPTGEANKYIYIFTKNLGFVGANAQSVRSVSSKLRYGLQDFSYSQLSLVRGKNIWRVTNVLPTNNLYESFRSDKEKFLVCANILSLVKKLVAGEEKNEELFTILSSAFQFLGESKIESEYIKNFECIVLLRILYSLGYHGDFLNLKEFTENSSWNDKLLYSMDRHKEEAFREINNAIKESHL